MKIFFKGIKTPSGLLYKEKKHFGGLLKLARHPFENIIAVGTGRCGKGEKNFALWEVNDRRARLLYYGKNLGGQVWGLDFSPSGRYLAVGVNGGKIHIYDVENPRKPREVIKISNIPLGRKSSRVKFYDDERLLVTSERGVHFYKLSYDSGMYDELWKNEIGGTYSIDYRDPYIVAGTKDDTVYLLSDSGEEIENFEVDDSVYSLKLVGDEIYVGSDGLYKISIADHEKEEIYEKGDVENIDYREGMLLVSIYESRELVVLERGSIKFKATDAKYFDAIFLGDIIVAAPECSSGESPLLVYSIGKRIPVKTYIEVEPNKSRLKGLKKLKRLEELYERIGSNTLDALREAAREGILEDLLRLIEEEGRAKRNHDGYIINEYVELSDEIYFSEKNPRVISIILGEGTLKEAQRIEEDLKKMIEKLKLAGFDDNEIIDVLESRSKLLGLLASHILAESKDAS